MSDTVKNGNKVWNVYTIAFTGMLGALSMVLMLIRFPLPFAPSFMEFDISELPALFAGFFIGPVGGAAVVVVKLLLKLIFQGTNTGFIGDFSNLVGSLAFVLPAAFIYKKNKTKKGAVIALVIATVFASVLSIFLNAFIMFPLYSRLYEMPMEVLVGMGAKVNPLVKDSVTLMIFAVFPFNLVKHTVTSLLTFLLYKRAGRALRKLMNRG